MRAAHVRRGTRTGWLPASRLIGRGMAGRDGTIPWWNGAPDTGRLAVRSNAVSIPEVGRVTWEAGRPTIRETCRVSALPWWCRPPGSPAAGTQWTNTMRRFRRSVWVTGRTPGTQCRRRPAAGRHDGFRTGRRPPPGAPHIRTRALKRGRAITMRWISLVPSDRKSTRLNSSHIPFSRMPSSA